MPKIQFKRKKSTGIGTNKLSAGEPLYNLYDKKLYIGGNASSDETPSKHLTEVGVSTAGKVSIGAATDNDFTIKAGTGISVSGNASNRNITIASNPTLTNNDTEANNVVSFTIDGQSYYKAIAVNIPGTSDEAKKLTTPRTIALAGDATGSVSFDGSQNVTLTADVKSAAKLDTARKIALSGAVTGETTFDGSADKTITTSYAINDAKSDKKIVRAVASDATGKLTTTKGSLVAGDGVTITESGNDLTISSPTTVRSLESGSTEIAFSVNGQEYRKTITVEGVGMSVDSANKWTTGRKITLTGDATGNVTIDGSTDVTLNVAVADNSHNHTISATGTDGLMDVTATGGANSVTIAVAPYTSQQSKASFDTSTTAPKLTTRLNYNGDLYATNMYGNNSSGTPTKVVLTDDSRLSDSRTPKSHSHGNITNGGIVGDASRVVITDASSKITTSSITTTKLGYLTDVTSNIQSQIDGKAPTSHASAQTTYGVSSASNYGHSKASATSPKMAGTAAVGTETGTFARGDHVHPTDTSRAASSHPHGNITNDGKLLGTAKVVVTDANGNITTSEITSEELDYLAGVGDYVQDQITANWESIDKIKDGISVAEGVLNITIW